MTTLSFSIQSPVGHLDITLRDDNITRLTFTHATPDFPPPVHPHTKYIEAELMAYFKCAKHPIQLPYEMTGTAFQRSVWQTLLTIPSGQVCTYGELAKRLNTSARAIGQACRTNPLPLLIPCHRVIAANGIGGFIGKQESAQKIKIWLLQHEGILNMPYTKWN